ncbi:hypothetical protein BDV12DRAFT_167840 [Aspergillus spectabilis]
MSTLPHPEKPMVTATATLMSLDSTSSSELISIAVANAGSWASEGWGSYIIPRVLDVGVSAFMMATSMLNQSAAEASMKPVTDFARRLGTLSTANITSTNTYSGLLDNLIRDEPFQALSGGGGLAMSSRILPRDNLQGS